MKTDFTPEEAIRITDTNLPQLMGWRRRGLIPSSDPWVYADLVRVKIIQYLEIFLHPDKVLETARKLTTERILDPANLIVIAPSPLEIILNLFPFHTVILRKIDTEEKQQQLPGDESARELLTTEHMRKPKSDA